MPPRSHRAALPPYDPIMLGRDARPWGLPTRPWGLPTWPPGLPTRAAVPRDHAHRPYPVARSRCQVPWSGPIAVGRDVPIAPPPYAPIAPYRHYAREVRTAITSAKYAPPLSRVAPAPTGTTCEKGRTSTRMPALVVNRKPYPLDYERRMSASLHNAARYASTSASGVRATPSFIAASATAVATVGRSMSSKGLGMM